MNNESACGIDYLVLFTPMVCPRRKRSWLWTAEFDWFLFIDAAASVFGELWRLEPLSVERRTMWRREMEWLLSVSDHIVELVPSWQRYPDGSTLEVCTMVLATVPRL